MTAMERGTLKLSSGRVALLRTDPTHQCLAAMVNSLRNVVHVFSVVCFSLGPQALLILAMERAWWAREPRHDLDTTFGAWALCQQCYKHAHATVHPQGELQL